nr:GTP-binding protein [Desulforamulus aquiferis]
MSLKEEQLGRLFEGAGYEAVNVIQGFLGSGKTTLIDILIREVFTNERILVIQSEWGERELPDYGPRVKIKSWDWEKGFNLVEVRKLIKIPGVDRIIFELNGMAPANELVDTLEIMKTRGEIELASNIAVFHGPTWEVMAQSLDEFFKLMALTSHGFWLREGNESLRKWIVRTQPSAYITTGGNWGQWYNGISKNNRRNQRKKLLVLLPFIMGMYLLYWYLIRKI